MNPYTLHPVEIAGQIAFLDAVSGGRAYLGLSPGAWLASVGITQARPLRQQVPDDGNRLVHRRHAAAPA